jgi:hypothetical protein
MEYEIVQDGEPLQKDTIAYQKLNIAANIETVQEAFRAVAGVYLSAAPQATSFLRPDGTQGEYKDCTKVHRLARKIHALAEGCAAHAQTWTAAEKLSGTTMVDTLLETLIEKHELFQREAQPHRRERQLDPSVPDVERFWPTKTADLAVRNLICAFSDAREYIAAVGEEWRKNQEVRALCTAAGSTLKN